MRTRKENYILAILGASVLANYQSFQIDVRKIEPAPRYRENSNRTDALIDEWRRLRAEAEIAAAYYEGTERPRRRRQKPNPAQITFFEKPFVAVANYFRRAGAEVVLGRVDARRLAAVLDDQCERWVRILRAQEGRWGEQRELEFAQAAAAAAFIAAMPANWRPLEIDPDFEIVGHRPDEIDVEVRIGNPNRSDAPIAPVTFMLLLTAMALVRWPEGISIPAMKSLAFKFTIPVIDMKCELEARFALPHEMRPN